MIGEDGERIDLKNYETYENADLPTKHITNFLAHKEEFTAMVFNPQGDVLATAGADKFVKFWNI